MTRPARTMSQAAVLPMLIIRIACLWPLVLLARGSLGHWHDIQSHEVLHHPPYGAQIFAGWSLAAGMGVFAAIWNILTLFPTVTASTRGRGLIPVGMVDFIIALCLIVAAALQTTAMPTLKSKCASFIESHGADSAVPSLFIVISPPNATAIDWQTSCKGFVTTWSYMIAMSIIYMLSGFLNIVLGIASYIGVDPEEGRRQVWHMLETICFNGCGDTIFLPIMLLAFAIIWIPVVLCGTLRFFQRSVTKFKHRKRAAAAEQELVEIAPREQLPQLRSVTLLCRLFDAFPVRQQIITNLHYVEMVNLSLACKELYQALLPEGDKTGYFASLRTNTCHKRPKTKCWHCANQLCYVCQKLQHKHPSSVLPHMTHCLAYCNTCYFLTKIDPPANRDRTGRPPCFCTWPCREYVPDTTNVTVFPVCDPCAALGQDLL